jgi:hypothetical protein
MFTAVSAVQQTITEFTDDESEEARTMAIHKLSSISQYKRDIRIHTPHKFIAFNANGRTMNSINSCKPYI